MAGGEDKNDGQGVVNTGFTVTEEPKRRVSISSDAIHADMERQRKISSDSSRKPPTLHNGDQSQQIVDNRFTHTDHPPVLNLDQLNKYASEKSNMSWWYLMCTKCRQKETGPGWEPTYWQSVCPYPFCPTYRHIARCLALVLVVLLSWGVVYSVIGDDAAPGGQLFDIALLVISAHFGGYLFRLINMPGLVGMLLIGVIYQNTGLIDIHGPYMKFSGVLRKIALVNILTRAGLEMDPGAMRRLFWTTLKLGLIPWIVEAAVVTVSTHYFLGLPWMWGLLAAAIVAAVSPAVVVPCLLKLRGKGYGVAKGIPTVVVAVSGIDDATSVAAFGIIQSLMFSEHSLAFNMMLGLASIVVGVVFGLFWGLIAKYVPEKGDPFVVPMRILMLLGGGLIAVFGCELLELEGAGPLGVVTAAFVSSWVWSTQGWEIEDNPVATAFEIFWMVFEPILFSLTGTQIDLNSLSPNMLSIIIGILVVACVLRQLSTVLVAFGGTLNMKEKIFVAISWMAKASVQAALAPAALDTVRRLGMGNQPEAVYAEKLLMTCVLSIALTAPVGAILITLTGPRLLSKTAPGPPEGWRRTARPSLRDITVIDEGNEADDIERRVRRHSIISHRTPSPKTRRQTPPALIITHQQ